MLNVVYRLNYIDHVTRQSAEAEQMAIVCLKDFPDNLHPGMKVQAAPERSAMKDLVIRLLEEYLAKTGQRKEA